VDTVCLEVTNLLHKLSKTHFVVYLRAN